MKTILGALLIAVLLSMMVLTSFVSYLLWNEVRDIWEDNKKRKRFEKHMEQTIRGKNDQDYM